jgi:uncharacterized membrane protein
MISLGHRALAGAAMFTVLIAWQSILDHLLGPMKEPFDQITFMIIFVGLVACLAIYGYAKVKSRVD